MMDDPNEHWYADDTRREILKDKPQVGALLKHWWAQTVKIFGRGASAKHPERASLSKSEYRPFHDKLLMVMVQDENLKSNIAKDKLFEDDWKEDAGGEDSIDETRFVKAMFELIDQWTETSDLGEYAQACKWLFFHVFEVHLPENIEDSSEQLDAAVESAISGLKTRAEGQNANNSEAADAADQDRKQSTPVFRAFVRRDLVKIDPIAYSKKLDRNNWQDAVMHYKQVQDYQQERNRRGSIDEFTTGPHSIAARHPDIPDDFLFTKHDDYQPGHTAPATSRNARDSLSSYFRPRYHKAFHCEPACCKPESKGCRKPVPMVPATARAQTALPIGYGGRGRLSQSARQRMSYHFRAPAPARKAASCKNPTRPLYRPHPDDQPARITLLSASQRKHVPTEHARKPESNGMRRKDVTNICYPYSHSQDPGVTSGPRRNGTVRFPKAARPPPSQVACLHAGIGPDGRGGQWMDSKKKIPQRLDSQHAKIWNDDLKMMNVRRQNPSWYSEQWSGRIHKLEKKAERVRLEQWRAKNTLR